MTDTRRTIAQAARDLNYSSSYIRKLADTGRIPCERTPLGRLFDPRDLDTFAASHRRRPDRHEVPPCATG